MSNKKKGKQTRTGYLISLDGNSYYEDNLEGELLIFDNLEQVAEYCNVNSINYDVVSVHEVEIEDA